MQVLIYLTHTQLEAQGGESAPVQPFFQHVEIAGARLTIDYRPRRVDVAALRVSVYPVFCVAEAASEHLCLPLHLSDCLCVMINRFNFT